MSIILNIHAPAYTYYGLSPMGAKIISKRTIVISNSYNTEALLLASI